MKICANNDCKKIAENGKYCSSECKREARLEIERAKAVEKHGEDWNADRPCQSQGCNEVITIRGRGHVSPSTFMRILHHSTSCAQKENARLRKLGLPTLKIKEARIEKAVDSLRKKNKTLVVKERAERIAFIRTLDQFADLPRADALIFNALRSKRFGDVPDCH